MNYLVYQAYGNIDNINECLYSLYTLMPFYKEEQIVIFTDKQAYFEKFIPQKFKLNYIKVTPEKISKWRGKFDFVHRFKIEMLRDFISNIEGENNILYLDTDTTFRQSIAGLFEQIAQGNLLMHLDEGTIAEGRKRSKFFGKIDDYINAQKKHAPLFTSDMHMWNAGVLGFRTSDLPLLNKVLEITDKVYEEFPKHVVEQMAFSLVFSQEKERTLLSAETEIFHYWNFKEFRGVLQQFFIENKKAKDLLPKIEEINPERLIQPKLAYLQLPYWEKQFKKMTGKWKMPDYNL